MAFHFVGDSDPLYETEVGNAKEPVMGVGGGSPHLHWLEMLGHARFSRH